MRSIISDSSIQQYLDKLLESSHFSYGIIIGQPSKHGKDYVIHLAKTPEEEAYDDEMTKPDDSPSDTKPAVHIIDEISAAALIEHSLRAVWMLPGGFYVLGIFLVTSETGILDQPESIQKLKHILAQLSDVFNENKTINASCDEYDNGEKLIFHYAGKRSFQCKTIEASTNTGKPADWKFQDRLPQWQQIETVYDTEYIFPLVKRTTGGFSLEENLSFSVDSIAKQLKISCVFFDGEPWDADNSLEIILKKKQNRNNEPSIIQSSIYFPCKERLEDEEARICRFDGSIKYSGIVSSKVWVQPKLLIADIERFIKADILRSISARLRLYLDASSKDFRANLEHIIITEPPRRVFFEMNASGIMFSDYLFRGESEDNVIVQAKDILDVEVAVGKVVSDVETISEIENSNEFLDTESRSDNVVPVAEHLTKDTQRMMMLLGVFFAIGVLFISIGLHFVFNSAEGDE